MAGSARNSTSTLAASAAVRAPSPAGPLARATRPDAKAPGTPGPRSGLREHRDKSKSKAIRYAGTNRTTRAPHFHQPSPVLAVAAYRSTRAPSLAAPRSCLLPASLPSAERPPTRDEGAPPDGAARFAAFPSRSVRFRSRFRLLGWDAGGINLSQSCPRSVAELQFDRTGTEFPFPNFVFRFIFKEYSSILSLRKQNT